MKKMKIFFHLSLVPFLAMVTVFTALHAQQPKLDWLQHWGLPNSSTDSITCMAVAPNEDIVTGGKFSGTIDFDPGPGVSNLTAASASDIHVESLDSAGQFRWAFSITGSPHNFLHTLQVDPWGNIYGVGFFEGTVDFDPGPGTAIETALAGTDGFIWKLDPLGQFLWVKTVAGSYDEQVRDIAIDANGAIYYCGSTFAHIDLDPGPGTDSLIPSFGSGYVVKLDASGGYVWGRYQVGPNQAQVSNVAIDDQGNVYCVGYYDGTMDFDQGPGLDTIIGNRDLFLWKLNNVGNHQWVVPFRTVNAFFEFRDMVTNVNGDVLLLGLVYDPFDLDPGPAVNYHTVTGPWGDIYYSCFDSGGNFRWGDFLGSARLNEPGGIAVDRVGNVYLSGLFGQTMDVDPGPGSHVLVAGGMWDRAMFASKLDPNGNFVWGEAVGAPVNSIPIGMTVTDSGTVYIGGRFGGGGDFDPGPAYQWFAPINGVDIFVTKWRQDSCWDFVVNFDSISALHCGTMTGGSAVTISGGTPPYNYLWSSQPPSIDSFATFTAGGWQTLYASDSQQCYRNLQLMVPGPTSTGIDLGVNLLTGSTVFWTPTLGYIDAANLGCSPVIGTVVLAMDTAATFLYSVPPATAVNGDTILWTLPNMRFDSAHSIIQFYYSAPNASLYDTLCFNVEVQPLTGDVAPGNNVQYNVCYPVLASYDPNDISVYPPGVCADHYVTLGEPLAYKVRFQNTGNAAAQTVVVLDTLPFALDPGTFRILGNSHTVQTQLIGTNVIQFTFANIYLPDSNTNAAASHGYVIFQVNPRTGTASGSLVSNRASIYFDNNVPVLTNRVHNTYVTTIPACPVALTEPIANGLSCHPNPSSGKAHLHRAGGLGELIVVNAVGQVVLQVANCPTSEFLIDGDQWSAGIYFIRSVSDGASQYVRWIKE